MIPVMAPVMRVRAVVLDCPDPLALSGFYAELLGWPPDPEPSPELSSPDCSVKIEFQRVSGYRPPTWPEGQRRQRLHLDFKVAGLAAEHDWALRMGARFLADESPDLRVYAEPAGRPS